MINTLLFMVLAILLGRSIEMAFSAEQTVLAIQLLVVTVLTLVVYIRHEVKE